MIYIFYTVKNSLCDSALKTFVPFVIFVAKN